LSPVVTHGEHGQAWHALMTAGTVTQAAPCGRCFPGPPRSPARCDRGGHHLAPSVALRCGA